MGGRDPGFAGACGPENDHLGGFAKGVEIVGLGRVERLDRGQRAFDFEFGIQEIYDLGGFELAFMAASFPIEVLTQGRLLLVDWRMNAHANGPRAGAATSATETGGYVRKVAGKPASGNVGAPKTLFADRSVTDEPP